MADMPSVVSVTDGRVERDVVIFPGIDVAEGRAILAGSFGCEAVVGLWSQSDGVHYPMSLVVAVPSFFEEGSQELPLKIIVPKYNNTTLDGSVGKFATTKCVSYRVVMCAVG